MRDWEFRFNTLVWTLMEFLWFGLFFLSVNLVFGQVEAVAGWAKDEALLLICVYSLFHDFLWTFVLDNMLSFSFYIRRGELDFVLLKPLSPRFYVSTRFFESDHYLKIVFLFFLINHFLGRLEIIVSLGTWLLFVVLFGLGLLVIYNVFFLLTTTNFWFINLFNLQELFDGIVDLARFPIYIFKGSLRFVFIYLIPVAFIATFPTQALLGQVGWEKVIWGIFLAIITFIISQWFWHFALKHYQSASS